ncbi:MAG: alpha/beta hydrolase [Actinobacteria bacterium]|nr:alpha/beta hydrolase [Actinomycetota bacterium]
MRHEIPSPPLDPSHFPTHRERLADGTEIAFHREGVGGLPVVLVHGWPGSKRLWWRNIEPLAAAGFEVIVPDARGFGDSSVPPGPREFADIPASAGDIAALLAALGHRRCVLVGGDVGSAVVQHLALSRPDLVLRQVVFNGLSPHLPTEYEEAGIAGSQFEEIAAVSDHLHVHGAEADALVAELDSPEARVGYVETFLRGRRWRPDHPVRHLAGEGNVDGSAAAFLAAPFADAARFRAGLGYYEAGVNRELRSAVPRLAEPNLSTPSLILYGVEDEIVGPNYPRRMEVALRRRVGPYLVGESGHFVQWERADVLNRAVSSFCADLLDQKPNPE